MSQKKVMMWMTVDQLGAGDYLEPPPLLKDSGYPHACVQSAEKAKRKAIGQLAKMQQHQRLHLTRFYMITTGSAQN